MGFTKRVDAFYITAIFCLSTYAEGAGIILFFYFFLASWETNRFGGRRTAGASGFLSWSVGKKDARPGQGRLDGLEGSGTVHSGYV